VGVSLDPDESLAQVEADVRRSDQRAAQMPAFEALVASVRGEAFSAARDLHVQVDSTGRVVALRIADSALARGARRLSQDLLAVIRAAEGDAQRATIEAVTGLLGPDDPIIEQLTSTGAAG